MPGLIDSYDGLEYGLGLYFASGLSESSGLINPIFGGAEQVVTAALAGSGSLRATAGIIRQISARLDGAGDLLSTLALTAPGGAQFGGEANLSADGTIPT